MQAPLTRLLPSPLRSRAVFMDYGLHRTPGLMRQRLQAVLAQVRPASRLLLGYGRCGNGLVGLRAGRHTLIVPQVDDCIAVLLGSRQAYRKQFAAEPGTYYLSTGWLEAGAHPLQEYRDYANTYRQAEADWIMDTQYRHYRRLAFIAHSREEREHYRPQALAVARYCRRWHMRYDEIIGSERFFRRMIAMIANPPADDDAFIVVPPGGQICQAHFET
jgi:hypothetical protein